MKNQKLKTAFVWLGSAALVALAYNAAGWKGVALVGSGFVFWLLLHFTRLMQALRRAANRPVGYIDSAVMFNAKLKSGVSLLHVIAQSKSLGQQLSQKDQQPEIFRWTDNGNSYVECSFIGGKLTTWQLVRPSGHLPKPDEGLSDIHQ